MVKSKPYTHRRILQLMAPAVPMTIVYYVDGTDPIHSAPVVALALVDEWYSRDIDSPGPDPDERVERIVMPMTVTDGSYVDLEDSNNILVVLDKPLTPELRTELEEEARKKLAEDAAAREKKQEHRDANPAS